MYTLVAGTVSTLVTTYSDRELTVPNTNPIVLNVYGEARIFTDIDLKLVYTGPTGDLTSPIWTEDYVASQQNVVADKGDGVWIGNNNYTLDIVPAYTSIPDGMSLVMMPNTTNVGTLVVQPGHSIPTVFTGTGINDGLFSGAYIGTVAGAVFSATIDSLGIDTPDAPVLAANAAVGLVTAGNHSVKITAVTAEGETEPSVASNIIAAAGLRKLDVSGIPAIAGTVTGYNIYLNKAGGTTWYFVALVTTTTYTINVADASLTVVAPTTNTTGDGSGVDTFSWQVDGGAVHSRVPITSARQSLQDGIFITIAGTVGHTVGDVWTVEVMTPVRVNFCSLGNILVYKSSGGELEVLDESDIIKGYPAHIDYSLAQNCWILINPSLPVLESLIPLRNRKTIRTDYVVDAVLDQGAEISAVGTLTITLPECPAAAFHFYYFRNSGTGTITIDAGIYQIKSTGQSTIIVPPYMSVQLATNGVDWHIMTMAEEVPAGVLHLFAGIVVPAGFLLCDGTAVSRTVYSRLFAVTGTVFGVGDGTTTFNLPDLRAKFPIGVSGGIPIGTSSSGGVLAAASAYPAPSPVIPGILQDADISGGVGWATESATITSTASYQAFNYIIKY